MNRSSTWVLMATAACLATPALAAGVTYVIDPEHTFPSFEADHFGLSLRRGDMSKTTGKFTFDKATGTGSVSLTFDLTAINFGRKDLYKWAVGPHFFDVAGSGSTATYMGTMTGFKAGEEPRVTGELTLHGVTKQVDIKVNSFACKPHPILRRDWCGADGVANFNRDDFGLGFGKDYGFDMNVLLRIEVEGVAEGPMPVEKLEMRGSRLFMSAMVNGVPTQALLDSAAEMTFVDSAFAAKIGLAPSASESVKGSGGTAPVKMAEGVMLHAAAVEMKEQTVAVIDMTDLSKRLVGEPINVVLGRELFDATRLKVDIKGGTIQALDRASEPAGLKQPLQSQRGIESAPCKVEGIGADADIDLGNGSEVLIGRKFAEEHGLLKPGRIVERKAGGGFGGEVTRDIIVLSKLEVGGVTFRNVRAAIDPQESAGEVNIGTSILKTFVLVIDFSGHAIWFQRN